MTVSFQLDGKEFIALNGGPHFKFTEAISFSVDCKSQEEVDRYLERGSRRRPGRARAAGSRTAIGLSWQINPTVLGEMLSDPDPTRSKRVMEAMLQMKKIDIAGLKQACRGQPRDSCSVPLPPRRDSDRLRQAPPRSGRRPWAGGGPPGRVRLGFRGGPFSGSFSF